MIAAHIKSEMDRLGPLAKTEHADFGANVLADVRE